MHAPRQRAGQASAALAAAPLTTRSPDRPAAPWAGTPAKPGSPTESASSRRAAWVVAPHRAQPATRPTSRPVCPRHPPRGRQPPGQLEHGHLQRIRRGCIWSGCIRVRDEKAHIRLGAALPHQPLDRWLDRLEAARPLQLAQHHTVLRPAVDDVPQRAWGGGRWLGRHGAGAVGGRFMLWPRPRCGRETPWPPAARPAR